MISVNKKDNGIMPLMSYYISAVAVMTRNEAKIMMKINVKNSQTVEEFLENIDDEIRGNKINDDVKKTNDFENFEIPTEKKLKIRCVRYLFDLMTNQKVLLTGLLSESEIREIEKSCLNNGLSVHVDGRLNNTNSDEKIVRASDKNNSITDNKKDRGSDSRSPKGSLSMSETNRRNILSSCKLLLEVSSPDIWY